LLQAIARVNRLHEGKDFGFIVDYYGVLKKLGDALDLFGSFAADFDEHDIANAVRDVNAEIATLSQRHTDLWQVFKDVKNKHDREAVIAAVEDETARDAFYSKLTAFARTLQVALSCAEFLEQTDSKRVARYKQDLKYFVDLRAAVQRRYAEKIDFKQYESRIQKLLDTHVTSGDVEIVVHSVSIFDKDAFEREIAKLDSDRSKALTIANRVRHAIREHIEEDPAFYKRFSELLEQAIGEHRQQRLDDATFLSRVREIAVKVRDRTGDEVPAILDGKDVAKAYFGALRSRLGESNSAADALAQLAVAIDALLRSLRIVNWTQSIDQQNRMRTGIEDELFAWADRVGSKLVFDDVDAAIEACLDIARVRTP
jgi:type I restriction enzyme R subunit